jgi:hypothetical protein
VAGFIECRGLVEPVLVPGAAVATGRQANPAEGTWTGSTAGWPQETLTRQGVSNRLGQDYQTERSAWPTALTQLLEILAGDGHLDTAADPVARRLG